MEMLKSYLRFSPFTPFATLIVLAFPCILLFKLGVGWFWGIPIGVVLNLILLITYKFSPSYRGEQ